MFCSIKKLILQDSKSQFTGLNSSQKLIVNDDEENVDDDTELLPVIFNLIEPLL
jgi:hypothetical protein